MKNEILIIVGIFVVLTIGMHYKEFLSHPIEHILALPHSSAYGLGAFHPFIFSLLAYIFLLIPRFFIYLYKKVISKK
ncbi:hypothetical protein CP965_08320 [Halarcobacter mediterraneus]|uniref:Uncharacterized protein n=1 Tax=Halarcobacter mediterraneus TaxID=2023153 RepID=A0A4V1M179_9BACT|nr:hypothetical protein [Halarcobacter mediterraneus]RXK12575.1 hypothetical protein CP965_08320 [Halarcobacter mediterraneus]